MSRGTCKILHKFHQDLIYRLPENRKEASVVPDQFRIIRYLLFCHKPNSQMRIHTPIKIPKAKVWGLRRIWRSAQCDIVEGVARGRRQDRAQENGRQDLWLFHMWPDCGLRHISLTVATSEVAPIGGGAGKAQPWIGFLPYSSADVGVSDSHFISYMTV